MDSFNAFDIGCLHRIVASFYVRGEVWLMRKNGYALRKSDKGRKILMEQHDIALYLSKYKKAENQSTHGMRFISMRFELIKIRVSINAGQLQMENWVRR